MILIIDNYDSFTYNLYQYIAPLCDSVKVVRNDKISIAEIEKYQPKGIILSPGPGRPENAGICVELIRHFSNSIPILGVCLGHQAIAVAFGGDVVSADEIVHGKSSLIYHNRSSLYQDIPLPFSAGRYHSLLVDRTRLPNILTIEAENNDGLIMGIRHQCNPTFGVQFHPESILTPDGSHLLSNFLQLCNEKEAIC
jgi:anthranilate synthase/aminodeoxychorismate synthase-like glutamine amidotransferase